MQFSKSTILAVLGLFIFLFLILTSYYNDQIFLDKILLCSFIIGMVFLVKMVGEGNNAERNPDNYS